MATIVRYNEKLDSYHYCDESEVNPNAEGWENVQTVDNPKAATDWITENKKWHVLENKQGELKGLPVHTAVNGKGWKIITEEPLNTKREAELFIYNKNKPKN